MKYLEKSFTVGPPRVPLHRRDYEVWVGDFRQACQCSDDRSAFPETLPLPEGGRLVRCVVCHKPWEKRPDPSKKSPFWRDPFVADS